MYGSLEVPMGLMTVSVVRRSLQHCRRWRRDCVQLTCWRHGLHHYDDDLWPRPLVLPTLTSSLPLSLLASKFRPTNAPHLVALPLMKRPGVSNASPWIPLGPRAQQRIPHDLLIFARPASVFGPCICRHASCSDHHARSLAPGPACLSSCNGRHTVGDIVSLLMRPHPRERPMSCAQTEPCGNFRRLKSPNTKPRQSLTNLGTS